MSSGRMSATLTHLRWCCCSWLGSRVGCLDLGPVNQCLSFNLVRSLHFSLMLFLQIHCLSSLRTKCLSPMRECSTHPSTALCRRVCHLSQLPVFAVAMQSSLRLMLDWLEQRLHRVVVDKARWSTIIEHLSRTIGLHQLVGSAAGPCQHLCVCILRHIVSSVAEFVLLCSVIKLHQLAREVCRRGCVPIVCQTLPCVHFMCS